MSLLNPGRRWTSESNTFSISMKQEVTFSLIQISLHNKLALNEGQQKPHNDGVHYLGKVPFVWWSISFKSQRQVQPSHRFKFLFFSPQFYYEIYYKHLNSTRSLEVHADRWLGDLQVGQTAEILNRRDGTN